MRTEHLFKQTANQHDRLKYATKAILRAQDNRPEINSLVRKRACGLTEILARALRDRGREVEVEHLHAHLPRVLKTPAHPEQETAR
ncbi:hypothetical protein ACIRP2_36645 [Streptomyces sp. NPDC101194]|uniref:hypothetical protein n=1 Tax=Streptomyces sp. NPDC101194 TaxID=3366127 RepID=UPI00380D9D2E